jgi:hypothetical protein
MTRSGMRKTLAITLLGVILSAAANAATAPIVFRGKDLSAGPADVSLELKPSDRGWVVVFMSSRCPCSATHMNVVKELAKEFGPKGYRFVGIHSNANETESSDLAHFAELKLGFPVLQDGESKYAERFNALKTPHAYVFDRSGKQLFQGGVTSSANAYEAKHQYLRQVLEALSAGKPAPFAEARTLGCVIARP